jgi:hypothetical protein
MQMRTVNAKLIAGLCAETGSSLVEERGRRFYSTAGDERTLRGIPAIGRGCPGRIHGSMPGTGPLFQEPRA